MWGKIKSIRLTSWIFIALALGFLIGQFLPFLVPYIGPFRIVFINGVKCIVAPLIFASIVTGINSAGTLSGLGRTGFRAIVYFEIATTAALFIGLAFVNWFEPGKGLSITGQQVSDSVIKARQTELTFGGFVEHLLPSNFADAIVRGDVLQIVLFSTIFGIAVLMAGEKGKPVLNFCEGLNEVMFKFTNAIMTFAPVGVGAAIAASVAEHGWEVMVPMFKMVGTLYLALLVFVIVVLVPAMWYAKVKIKAFFRELKPSLVLAVATTSSESAYPSALKSLEKMGVSKRISSFVLPLGYSFNLDGSTLYLAIASVFIAQAAGIELSMGTQLAMMLTLMLTTKGVAAVPRASMVVLSGTLVAFGLPVEGIMLILGVDEFMDMARTGVNLLGNCVATTVVSRWEGENLNPEFTTSSIVVTPDAV
ncbi:MAG: cation:dicarboxylase symporter family transporter [Proteobacteria bacterium]|jgi:proton glutamate symport protein|nr:cation:dicarboxylase symporter family transporter [Pseudomonadota bacterium]